MNSSLVIYIVVDTERCKTWICYVTMLALNSENPYLPSAEIPHLSRKKCVSLNLDASYGPYTHSL